MDQSSYRRRPSPIRTSGGLRAVDFSQLPVKFLGSGTMTLTRTFTTCLILFSVLLAFSMIFHHHTSDPNRVMGFADARVLEGGGFHNITNIGSNDFDKFDEKLLGGLLATGFDEDSCLSRYQQVIYRKPSPYKPSPYLVSKLRNYEMRHKQCGPGTEAYTKAIEQLGQEHITSNGECKYVVWISFSGLGNRILSLASVYLYALLTDRVLLVDRGKDMNDLFCEPFPGMSWLLPLDFPLAGQFDGLTQQSSRSYGNMLKNRAIDSSSTEKTLSHLYLHLLHDYGDHDKMFFCEEDQTLIGKVPWLIVKTDNYFIPSLWLIPGFDHELDKLFPDKETVFHHIGRYLFHPSNQVWGLITRYYEAYLSRADEKIGIQVRVFDEDAGPFQHVMDQIAACTQRERLLPEVDTLRSQVTAQRSPKLKAVLVTSLSSGYSENLKSMYWEYPTSTGDIVGVHQPSQEGYQQTEKKMHNGKALAEMYLLSMTDNLVTSAWSTFGYVAQGLGGLKPWILYKPENRTAPNPPCGRAMSMEPCFHSPPFYDCKAKKGIDTGKVVPHVRHCEDISWGLKLVNSLDDV